MVTVAGISGFSAGDELPQADQLFREALQMARNTIKKIDTFIYRLHAIDDDAQNFPDVDQVIYDLHHGLEKALDDDMNISGALAALFDFIGKANAPLTQGKISRSDARKIIKALEKINEIVGIMDFGEQTLNRDITGLIQKEKRLEKREIGRKRIC
ncbi:MAG: hypothetical protein MZV70_31815 [Desulfobacterales bacterium]|nr:hypothetical protein [Desulfobacterales bacterium]